MTNQGFLERPLRSGLSTFAMKYLCLVLVFFVSLHCAGNERIMVYSQYDFAPFWLGQGKGLSVDLAHELSRRSSGRYEFVVQITPRKRLDYLMSDAKWQGIIPWVSPEWFQDKSRQRYVWSGRLMPDADIVLSQKAMLYAGPESLLGHRFGGVLGHHYVELEALLSAGKILRDDAITQDNNLSKLKAGRIDVIFFPHSSWVALKASSPETSSGIFVAKKTRSRYDRYILISPNNPELAKYIIKTTDDLQRDPLWVKKIAPYRYVAQ